MSLADLVWIVSLAFAETVLDQCDDGIERLSQYDYLETRNQLLDPVLPDFAWVR